MKTNLLFKKISFSLLAVCVCLFTTLKSDAQTYTTIANGPWDSTSTWQAGIVPSKTIPALAVVNIRHMISDSTGDITNNGTLNIYNPSGITPHLYVSNGVNFTNNLTGKVYITGAEYQQYRFAGGGESGTSQNGNFTNNGYVQISSSYVEVAKDWTNNAGAVVFKNSSLVIGQNYQTTGTAIDTLSYTSVSIGWQGSGNFQEGGASVYFWAFRAELAGTSGNFQINNISVNGEIDYIMLKNDYTGVSGNGSITISGGIKTQGLTFQAYCISNSKNYKANGKVSGPQTAACSLNYFPAVLNGATSPRRMNFSTNPTLVSGTDLQAGAQYIYKGVAPGIDALVHIDSIVNGAVIKTVDDNTGANGGYIEAFQPIITSGTAIGKSYAVFTFKYNITGTTFPYALDTFNLTALDIDGQGGLEEFDQIAAGKGATASFVTSNPKISLSQTAPGTFLGMNTNQVAQSGVDTTAKQNMFTVTNSNMTGFTVTLGINSLQSIQTQRLFSLYTAGFNYPASPVTLPVTLGSFTAILGSDEKKVNLNWTTESQLNFSHFIVERSTNGKDFSQAGVVFAGENTYTIEKYGLVDNISSLHSILIYYRLAMVDVNGLTLYSEIQVIRVAADNDLTIRSYPNPATSEIHITLPVSWQNKHVVYEVFNSVGQLSKISDQATSSQTETINVSNLSRGMYLVRVSCDGEKTTQKFLKN